MHPLEEEIFRARHTEACPLHSQTDAVAARQRNDAMGHNRTHAQPQSRSSVPSSAPEGSGSASATKVDEYRYDCCVQDGT